MHPLPHGARQVGRSSSVLWSRHSSTACRSSGFPGRATETQPCKPDGVLQHGACRRPGCSGFSFPTSPFSDGSGRRANESIGRGNGQKRILSIRPTANREQKRYVQRRDPSWGRPHRAGRSGSRTSDAWSATWEREKQCTSSKGSRSRRSPGCGGKSPSRNRASTCVWQGQRG